MDILYTHKVLLVCAYNYFVKCLLTNITQIRQLILRISNLNFHICRDMAGNQVGHMSKKEYFLRNWISYYDDNTYDIFDNYMYGF